MTESVSIPGYLGGCRELVIEEIRAIVPSDSPHTGDLYSLMLDYPLRGGKAIRPALSMAVCRGAGGSLSSILPTAAVLELYHNAFLIHDDIEDRSDKRRSKATLNRAHGMPTAVNVGDGMLALAIRPLLDNMAVVGLGKAIKILRVVSQMARQTAEGQMIELQWISSGRWTSCDSDYLRLVYKKTAWYSFIAPMMVGGIAAGLKDDQIRALGSMAIPLGIAFQIQDDILNLASSEVDYDKDYCADLWESKRTLILMHALRSATSREREHALKLLAKSQPGESDIPDSEVTSSRTSTAQDVLSLLQALVSERELSQDGFDQIARALNLEPPRNSAHAKTAADVAYLRSLIERYGSVDYAWRIAQKHAAKFRRGLERITNDWPSSIHRDFLFDVHEFTIQRQL